jgi:hypothetical protein
VSNTSRFLTALGRVIRTLTGERPSASTGAAQDAAAARSSVSTALLSPGQAGPSATVEIDPMRLRDVRLGYTPAHDGEPDPGEIVWTWVPFEEDYTRGKDRPVLVVGSEGAFLLALILTSKDHDRDAADEARWGRVWMDIGSGPWDKEGRRSEVRLDRVLRIDPAQVRREGAVIGEDLFNEVAAELHALHRG